MLENKVEAELYGKNEQGKYLFLVLMSDNNLYMPTNLQAYINPFSSGASFKFYSSDTNLINLLLEKGQVDYGKEKK